MMLLEIDKGKVSGVELLKYEWGIGQLKASKDSSNDNNQSI